LAKNNSSILSGGGNSSQEINDDILLEELVKRSKGNCGGECGWNLSVRWILKNRNYIFETNRAVSKYQKPLIIHARKAVDEVIQILSEYENLRGVILLYRG